MKNLITIISLFLVAFVQAQPLSPLTVNISMSDSKTLAADVYIPQPEMPRPTILIQTPYNKNLYRWSLPLGIGLDVNSSQYNIVIVDWRGFYGSAAAFVAQYDRGLDGYDCIEWISQQSWSNGKVGTWGPSALGKIQFLTAKHQHPAHICMVPLVASPDYRYEEYYPGGVYREEYVEQLDALGYGMSTTLKAHPYFDFTWQYVQNQNSYPQQIIIPCLMISGWFDHDANLKTDYHATLRNQAATAVRDEQWLIMGPWVHGGHGASQVGSGQQGELFFPEAAGFSETAALQFFDYYLLDADNNWFDTPYVQYFQMGDNEWLSAQEWPPAGATQATTYYLTGTGMLRPNVSQPVNSYTSFAYDPRDPSPTIGGPTLRNDLLQGPYDQASLVEGRNDIAIFTSASLTNPVVVKGRPTIKLFVSTDCFDTDVAVRLTDVYPDNRSILLLDNIYRLRFDGGFGVADTSFVQAGEIREIEIELYDIAHTFLPGHKIRLDITGSNWPRYQRNKNTTAEPFEAGDTLISNTRIYHQNGASSYLQLPVVENSAIAIAAASHFSIYPNPVSHQLFVESDGTPVKTISVFSLQGQKLNCPANPGFIDVAHLNQGMYFVRIETESGTQVLPFIKE